MKKSLLLILVVALVFIRSLAQEDDEFASVTPVTKIETHSSPTRGQSGSKEGVVGGGKKGLEEKGTDDDEDDDDEADSSDADEVKINDDNKPSPAFLPPRRTGQPIFEYVLGGLTAYFLINYIVGRLSNSRRVKALSRIIQPILQEQFSSVGIKATDTDTGFSIESDSEYSGFSSGRKYCVGALVSINLAPRQDLFRSLLGMFFSSMRTRDSITFEIPLSAGDAFFLAIRAPLRASSAYNNPLFSGASGAANPFAQTQGYELVNEEACNELERNPKTLKSFYRSIKTSPFLGREMAPTSNSSSSSDSNSNSSSNNSEIESVETTRNEIDRSASTPSRAAVALDELEILLEQKDIVSMSYLGGALKSFIYNAGLLQSGGITAKMRMGAPLPPARFRLHITDLPDLCHGFKTAHLCSPEGGRVTLVATLALPTSGGAQALSSYLPQAVQSIFSLVDCIATLSAPSSTRLVARDDRNKLEDEKQEAIEAEREQRRQREKEKEKEQARLRMTDEERLAEDEREKEKARAKEFKKLMKQSKIMAKKK